MRGFFTLLTALALVCGLSNASRAQLSTQVGGESCWWQVGDYLMFLGDSNTISLACGQCDWGCQYDLGMVFVRLATYSEYECTGSPGPHDRRYQCYAEGCVLLGVGTYGQGPQCTKCASGVCYCHAIFEVTGKSTVSGGTCYILTLVCDPDDDDSPCTDSQCFSNFDANCSTPCP